MVFDLTGLTQALDALSSVSLKAGAVFVIFQLGQNAKLLKDSERQLAISNKQVEATLPAEQAAGPPQPRRPFQRRRL